MKSKISAGDKKGEFCLEVLNPTGVLETEPIPPVPRLRGLNNKKIGLYWNHKARGNVALSRVQELLSDRFEGVSFVWFKTPISVGASKEWIDNVKKSGVDAVVASTGDCGSCTSWLIHNCVKLEEVGIPIVSIVSNGFVADAKASAEAFGLPNPALAVTPFTFTGLTPELTRRATDELIEDIIRGLTKPLPKYKGPVVKRMTTRGLEEEVIEFKGKDYRKCFQKMNDCFLDYGWSDGFPLIPATEEAMEEMVKGTSRSRDDTIVEKLAPGMARATVGNIAINAVMAGCKPEFLPVVITAVEAMADPAIDLRVVAVSTSPHAPLFVVNGPVAEKLSINSGLCALGPAGPEKLSFPNVVIGRAVRLVLMNVGNVYPGIMDQDTIGSPTKFSMVLAENEKANPWEPYHVEKGFDSKESTVSCFYGHSIVEMCDLESDTAEGLMNTFARHLTGIGGISGVYYKPVMLLTPDHARILKREGWAKNDVRQYLHIHCRIPAEEYRRSGCAAYPKERKWIRAADSRAMIPLYEKPEDIQIVVVGGMAGKSAAYAALYPANPCSIQI